MVEYIDRDALIKRFEAMGLGEHGLCERIFADGVYSVISTFPAADVAPVRHGRWMGTVCSACGRSTSYYYDCDYCPHCSAKMDLEEAQ